jgi:uncharacterized protein (TIGR02001 family)
MKKTLLPLIATLAVGALPAVSHAEDANPLSFNVSVTSDYRYRGISQSRLKPALQGGADYAHPSGFYVGTWGSTISWIKDAGTITGVDTGSAPVEIDIYGGYKGEITKGLGYDVGLLQYWYPGNKLDRIAENANTLEIYGALTYGPVTLKYSHSLTTLFGTPDSKGSGYLDLSATFDLGNGYSVVPHVGAQRIKNFTTYVDYSVTGNKDFGDGLVLSLGVVSTNWDSHVGFPYTLPGSGTKDLAKTGVVVGLKKSF